MGSSPETHNDPLERDLLKTKLGLQSRENLQSSVWTGGGGGGEAAPTMQTSVKCRVFVEQYLR